MKNLRVLLIDGEYIGVFSSTEKALAERKRLMEKEGYPNSYEIIAPKVDKQQFDTVIQHSI